MKNPIESSLSDSLKKSLNLLFNKSLNIFQYNWGKEIVKLTIKEQFHQDSLKDSVDQAIDDFCEYQKKVYHRDILIEKTGYHLKKQGVKIGGSKLIRVIPHN